MVGEGFLAAPSEQHLLSPPSPPSDGGEGESKAKHIPAKKPERRNSKTPEALVDLNDAIEALAAASQIIHHGQSGARRHLRFQDQPLRIVERVLVLHPIGLSGN